MDVMCECKQAEIISSLVDELTLDIVDMAAKRRMRDPSRGIGAAACRRPTRTNR